MRGIVITWFTDKTMEAQRGPESHPKSHSDQKPDLGLEPWQSIAPLNHEDALAGFFFAFSPLS